MSRALGIRETNGAIVSGEVLVVQSPNGLEQGPGWYCNVTLMAPGPVSSVKGLDMQRTLVSLSQSGKSVLDAIRTAVKIKLQGHTGDTTCSF